MKVRRVPTEAFSPFTIKITVESDLDVQAINYMTTTADESRRRGCPTLDHVTAVHSAVQGLCAMLERTVNPTNN